MPDGRIESQQVERLHQIGAWLKSYGESIYDTRGGPFQPGTWGASTHVDNSIYLHILSWPEETLILSPLAGKVVDAVTLTGGRVMVEQNNTNIAITVEPADRDPVNTLVRLTVDG